MARYLTCLHAALAAIAGIHFPSVDLNAPTTPEGGGDGTSGGGSTTGGTGGENTGGSENTGGTGSDGQGGESSGTEGGGGQMGL